MTEEEKKRYGELTGVLTELSDGAINEWIGYAPTIDVDGYYGPQTESAVKEIQKKKGVEETGVVDLDLWNELTDTSKLEF